MSVILRNCKAARETEPRAIARNPVRREIKSEPGRHLEPGSRDARLQEIEDRLLAHLIDTHPNSTRALDRLLHDVLDDSHAPIAPRALPLKGDACISRRVRQTEDLLLAAVIENHPYADCALDRLLEDICPEDDNLSQLCWDNDWDGLA